MKFKSLLIASLVASSVANGQVTLQGSALSGWMPGTDSLTGISAFTATAMANGNWDLTTATYAPGYYTLIDVAATLPDFPLATYKRAVSYSFSSNMSYQSNMHWAKDNSGITIYGESMVRQPYPIGALTMNPNDSLIFPEQVITYSAPLHDVEFPMSFGDHWTNSYMWNTDFELTYTAASLNNAPGQRRSYMEQRDSVKGWGKMRVEDITGTASAYMDVLAVQTTEMVTDSFFLMGGPAPAQLLMGFGLTQGMVTNRYTTRFFRSGEVTPLLTIEHTNNTFTTMTDAEVMLNRHTPAPNSINGISAAAVNVYPNPVTDGRINVTNLAAGNWTYTLTSLSGQKVSGAALNAANGSAVIALDGVSGGVYHLSLSKDGMVQSSELVIIK
jgi:hypothetical protein